jgi:hypothetical protein
LPGVGVARRETTRARREGAAHNANSEARAGRKGRTANQAARFGAPLHRARHARLDPFPDHCPLELGEHGPNMARPAGVVVSRPCWCKNNSPSGRKMFVKSNQIL